jgi:hypothetical protein
MKNKPTLSKRPKKTYTPKGELSAGMAYLILAILIIVAGGSLMTGNFIPSSSKSPTDGQPVITLPANTSKAKNNLQLFTFPGATYTPTPTPTPIPTATPEPTSTPGPTNTPGPTTIPGPTNTPGPTATPEPTAIPVPPTGIAL